MEKRPYPSDKTKKLLIVAETLENTISASSLELFSAAPLLGITRDETLFIVPGQDIQNITQQARGYGYDILALEHEALKYHNPPFLADMITSIARELGARHIVFPHTMQSASAAARTASLLGRSVFTAVEDIALNGNACTITRSLFNGKILMTVEPAAGDLVMTLQPGSFAAEPGSSSPGTIYVKQMTEPTSGYESMGAAGAAESSLPLNEADVIIAGGRGLGSEPALELLHETAAIFKNSAVGASRSLCDNGWLPYAHQVGMTGKTVSPRLYMACGISGAQQHIVGMKGSQTIVAVNTDPYAHIFSVADYGIVDDLHVFLPALVQAYREKFGR